MAPPPRWLRREVFVGLALGQFVSLLITSTGFSSSELARRGTLRRRCLCSSRTPAMAHCVTCLPRVLGGSTGPAKILDFVIALNRKGCVFIFSCAFNCAAILLDKFFMLCSAKKLAFWLQWIQPPMQVCLVSLCVHESKRYKEYHVQMKERLNWDNRELWRQD